MKKVIFILAAVALMVSCDNRTPAQKAHDDFEKEMQERESASMERERYIDSLVNVATGLNGSTLRANRQHALDILKKEYPEMSERWDAVQKSIDNLEVY